MPQGSGNASHYQGYEAALFNAAQAYMHQQSGPKAPHAPMQGSMSGGMPPGPMPPGGIGKGGKKAKFFNQRWATSNTQQLHYCEVCKISCASKLIDMQRLADLV